MKSFNKPSKDNGLVVMIKSGGIQRPVWHIASCAAFLLVSLIFTGCIFPLNPTHTPEMVIEPTTIEFSRTNVRDTLTIRNDGSELLRWRVRNWPDWVILDTLEGEVASEEEILLAMLADLAFYSDTGTFTDSIVFRSDGGNPSASLKMIVDSKIPPNGVYSGRTSEGLLMSIGIYYDRVVNFNVHYFADGDLKVRSLPAFGEITHSQVNFTSAGKFGSLLTGVFDGFRSIHGTWVIEERLISFSLTREE